MADFAIPFKSLSTLSLIESYTLVNYQPNLLLSSHPSYLGTFIQLWILQFFIWSTWSIIIWPKFLSPIRHLPSPSGGSWWNGHFHAIITSTTGGPMTKWVNEIPNDGLIYYRGLLNVERLIPTSPKALAEVLVTNSYDFTRPESLTAALSRILGVGVLLAEGDEHRFQRKHLAPAFAFRHIKNLYPIFWTKSRENIHKMVEFLAEGGTKKELITDSDTGRDVDAEDTTPVIEVISWASRVTLDIIGVAGMGKDFNTIQDPNALLARTYQTIFTPTKGAMFLHILGMMIPIWFVNNLPFSRNNDMNQASSTIRNLCRREIKEKKEKLEKGAPPNADILSIAMGSGGFTDENLVDQMMTFLAAGHETSASSLTWAIYMLCLHPEMQTRLRTEIREYIPSLSNDIGSQEIDRMPYLNAVCNEVLRYYPPVPLTPRIAARNTTIQGQKVPKGTRVMLIPWAINRSEALWGKDAQVFNPERWLPSESNPYSANGGARSNYSLLTFLHGPRSCIGQGMAKGELACLLTSWVGMFEFSLYDRKELDEANISIKVNITARPSKGMWVRAKVVPGW